jgi:hypothetical protein
MGRIGLAVVLIGLFIAPLVAEAQPAGKVATVGILAIEAFPPSIHSDSDSESSQNAYRHRYFGLTPRKYERRLHGGAAT